MLAEKVSTAVSTRFSIPPPPTIAARLAGSAKVAFTHFASREPKPGLSLPSDRDQAFVFNVPLERARYSVVSIDGRRQSVVQAPGEAYLFDLTSRTEVSLDTTYNSVRFHISQTSIDDLAYEKGLRRVGGLFSKSLGREDRILHGLALAILPAIIDPREMTTAFVEYIALAFHDHAIHAYGGLPRSGCGTAGLAPWQVKRAQDYMDANLAGDLAITTLGRECGMSASYFIRAFRVSIGKTPHRWITKRRIDRAKSMMAGSDATLAEISLACGFTDQSHFGKRFLADQGSTPAQWRRMAANLHGSSTDRQCQ